MAGDGLSTRWIPILPSSSAPRLLRGLLRAGLFEELHAELCEEVWVAGEAWLLGRCPREHPLEHRGLST